MDLNTTTPTTDLPETAPEAPEIVEETPEPALTKPKFDGDWSALADKKAKLAAMMAELAELETDGRGRLASDVTKALSGLFAPMAESGYTTINVVLVKHAAEGTEASVEYKVELGGRSVAGPVIASKAANAGASNGQIRRTPKAKPGDGTPTLGETYYERYRTGTESWKGIAKAEKKTSGTIQALSKGASKKNDWPWPIQRVSA